MTRPSDEGRCDLCGEPMPEGETMFRFHGYSGPCPKPPLPVTTPTHCACVWHGQADGPPFSECHYHATLRADLAAARALLRCNVTNKLCGTDTWFVGYSCPCASCEAWLAARKVE